MKKFEGRYKVADGYAGGSRPQYFTVEAGELEDDMTDDDLKRYYEESAGAHFQEHICPDIQKVNDFVAWAREQLNGRRTIGK